tara:strand:+ start:462 stop:686 length:225 start_codon:yes stop_codon:yes gene_type:complete
MILDEALIHGYQTPLLVIKFNYYTLKNYNYYKYFAIRFAFLYDLGNRINHQIIIIKRNLQGEYYYMGVRKGVFV